MIPKFSKYHWFTTRRKSDDESWREHAANLAAYVEWCEKNIGIRTGPIPTHKWIIVDKDGKSLPTNRSYNVQTFFGLGIEDSELAMLFRLKFNI